MLFYGSFNLKYIFQNKSDYSELYIRHDSKLGNKCSIISEFYATDYLETWPSVLVNFIIAYKTAITVCRVMIRNNIRTKKALNKHARKNVNKMKWEYIVIW